MSLAKAYEKAPHLPNWTLPRWMELALKEVGQAEVPGAKSNPRIIEYRTMAGLPFGAMDDGKVPWCAIFVNAMLAQAGVKTSGSAMARSFVRHPDFIRIEQPMVGCITVIASPSRGAAAGHVFFYSAEKGIMLQGLGGNQNDSVSVEMFRKANLVGHFWPKAVPPLAAPFDKPVRLARSPLLHEREVVRDA